MSTSSVTTTLSTSLATGITITPTGTYQSPFTITSTGTIAPTTSSLAALYGSAASGLTLINQGVITGSSGITGGYGVDLAGEISFSNGGTITGGYGGAGVNGGAGGAGVYLSGSGLFANSAAIIGGKGHSGGGIGGAGLYLTGAGLFNNSGTITGGSGSSGNGTPTGGGGGNGGSGVDLFGTGSFTNSGTITGGNANPSGGGAGGSGVNFAGAGSFSNRGTLIGGSGSGSGQFGAFFSAAGTGGSGANFAGIGSFSNRAIIIGGTGIGDGNGGAGLVLSGAGSLNNSATITGGAGGINTGDGGAGVILSGTGAFTNDALLIGGAGGNAGIFGGGNGGVGLVLSGTGAFNNSATLTGGNGGAGSFSGSAGGAGGNGVDLTGAGRSSNSATILGGAGGTGGPGATISGGTGGIGGLGGIGVDFSGSGGFSNNAAITGGAGGGSGTGSNNTGGAGGNGVDLSGGGTFTNSGTITGGVGGSDGYHGVSYGVSGTGVDLTGSGIFNNSGLIIGGPGATGPGGLGGNGVDLAGSGTFNNSGTIASGAGGLGTLATGLYLNGGLLLNSGLITSSNGNAVQFGTNASTLVVDSGALFQGNVVANATAADTLAIGGTTAVSLSGIGTQFQNFRALAFDPGATGTITGTYTALDSQSLSVTGFVQGDTIILDGFAATSETFISGIGLKLSNGTSHITIDITGSFSTADFNVIDPPTNTTISLNAPCFAAGTRILTTRGEIAVENLTLNDHVILDSGTTAPIQWLGFRFLSLRHHPRPEQVNPIHIQAGALADNIPHRDLFLSPDHALYLDGALIPAKTLINGSTIRQINVASVTYYHVELPAHAILLAEGTPTESYLETGNRGAFTNSDSLPLILHPNLAQTKRETESCAPFTEHGPLVEAVRTRILARANISLTTDPNLTIQTKPDGSVAIISRSGIPGQLTADPRDQRRLGVKIASLEIGGAKIPLDHPLLTEGWHTTEPDGRWTNGRGIIPAELAQGEKVGVKLAATLAYPADQRTSQHAAA